MSPGNLKLYSKIQRLFQGLVPGKTLVFFVLFSWIVGGCAFKKVPQEPSAIGTGPQKTSRIEPEARPLFLQAEKLYNQKNFSESAKLFIQIRSRFPRSRAATISSYRLGSIYYYQGNYQLSETEFEGFLKRNPEGELTVDATYNLAATQYQLGKHPIANQTLSQLKFTDLRQQGVKRAEAVYQLGAQIAIALGDHRKAVQYYSYQLQLPQTETGRKNIEENIHSELALIKDPSLLQALFEEVSEPTIKTKISKRILELNGGQTSATSSTEEIPNSDQIPPLPLSWRSESNGEKPTVGIVLPLTGRYAAYGKKALDGILLAAQTFTTRTSNPNGTSNIEASLELAIEDSASSPVLAQMAVERLVRTSQVSAIIGPLNLKESIAAAEKSQELGVPNLSLNSKEGISQYGTYLFQNALTPKVQLENLVEYAVKERGLKRFAIFAPANSFGKDMTNEFWEAVEKLGGHIMAFEMYPPEEKDFQSYVQSAVGVSLPQYRALEWKKMNDWAEEEKKRSRKSPKLRLTSIVDFDAIFIPDAPRSVGSLAASLAFFDVIGLPLLGTNEWNSPEFYRRGGKYVEGAIFPGSISKGSKNTNQKEFIKKYQEAYGTLPDLLSVQAYEAMALISYAVQKSGTGRRSDVAMELQAVKNFESPLGTLSFDETRVAKRRLPIYMLETGGVIVEQ